MTTDIASGRAVDTATALYADAGDRAFRKWPHQGPRGSTVLEYTYDGSRNGCGGKLLTASVRVADWRSRSPKWTAVGVVCMSCGAWWPKPAQLAEVAS